MNSENLQHFAFIPAKLVPLDVTPEEAGRITEKDNEIARLTARLNDATDILRSIRFDLPTNTVGRESIEYFLYPKP